MPECPFEAFARACHNSACSSSCRPSLSRGFATWKERVIWRNEFETIDQARAAIGAYVDHDHDRPHLGMDYRTPKAVRQTWEDAGEEFDGLQKQAA
jgi:hypothetical protein